MVFLVSRCERRFEACCSISASALLGLSALIESFFSDQMPWGLFRLGRPWGMARFPRLKFASQILAARFVQLGNDLGVLRCQPVLQFIERFDRRKHWHWDFDSVLRHSGS